MRLQFLGDSRDAFKWDLIHWMCTNSSFSKLVYVPLLTPDDPECTHGQSPQHRFPCRQFIRPFLEMLKESPRSLTRIPALGSAEPQRSFDVSLYALEKVLERGYRHSYWSDLNVEDIHHSVVFFDPDIGYETRTQTGEKWIRHHELREVLSVLPETSILLVYQHRPYLTWERVFKGLSTNLAYVNTAAAVYDHGLAFVGMAGNGIVGKAMTDGMKAYTENVVKHQHKKFADKVRFTSLVGDEDASNAQA